MSEKLLTVSETAITLGVKEKTIRRWILLRKVTYVKLGAAVRIPQSEISRLIEAGTVSRLTSQSWPAHEEQVLSHSP